MVLGSLGSKEALWDEIPLCWRSMLGTSIEELVFQDLSDHPMLRFSGDSGTIVVAVIFISGDRDSIQSMQEIV